MVDKNLETDREVTLEYVDIENDNNFEIAKHENVLIDLIEQKRAADLSDKVKTTSACENPLLTSFFRFALCAESSTRRTFCSKSFRSMSSHIFVTIPVRFSAVLTTLNLFPTPLAIFKATSVLVTFNGASKHHKVY